MLSFYKPSFREMSFVVVVFGLLAGCGQLSNVVDLNFPEVAKSPSSPPSSPFVGLVSSGGARTSGQFRLEGGIGNQIPNAVKVDGSFKFYGGIHGQVVSR